MAPRRKNLGKLLTANAYPGRGIVVGKSSDGKCAVFAYFIMGRSENSRNRVFVEFDGGIRTQAFDESKVTDPSLIIYSAVRTVGKDVVVTNGDQTDTIADALQNGKCFRHALMTRRFEPDAPNFTPRISAILHFGKRAKDFSYEMSILKSADSKGKACNRFFYAYEPVSGVGHFIHTYLKDGAPLPSFEGEPTRVKLPASCEELCDELWNSLNPDNKISLVCRYTNLATGEVKQIVKNKNAD